MQLAALIKWIDAHLTAAPTIDNGDGTLTVATPATDQDGNVYIERDIIPATLQAARNLLGY